MVRDIAGAWKSVPCWMSNFYLHFQGDGGFSRPDSGVHFRQLSQLSLLGQLKRKRPIPPHSGFGPSSCKGSLAPSTKRAKRVLSARPSRNHHQQTMDHSASLVLVLTLIKTKLSVFAASRNLRLRKRAQHGPAGGSLRFQTHGHG